MVVHGELGYVSLRHGVLWQAEFGALWLRWARFVWVSCGREWQAGLGGVGQVQARCVAARRVMDWQAGLCKVSRVLLMCALVSYGKASSVF